MVLIQTDSIRITADPDLDLWKSFVLAHPCGTIFQYPGISSLYNAAGSSSGVVAAIDNKGTITGVLVYVILAGTGKQKLFTKRAIISGGPLAVNNDPVILQLLLNAYEQEVKKAGIIYTEIRNHHDTSTVRPAFEQLGYRFTDHLNIYIDLLRSDNELIQDVHKKRMSNIRRAVKKGVISRELKTEDEIRLAYNLIKKTYHRVNLPLPPADLFLKAAQHLGGSVEIYGAFSQGEMIGARVYLLFRDTVYDWYAGSDESKFHLHPNDILPWDMIWRGKKAGFSTYDFGGAGNPAKPYGVRTYKERFGGQTINRGRYRKVHKRLLYGLGSFAIRYYKFFRHL